LAKRKFEKYEKYIENGEKDFSDSMVCPMSGRSL